MDRLVVKELIQKELNIQAIRIELKQLLENWEYRNTMINDYKSLKEKLGGPGASKRTAELICNFATGK